VTIERRQRKGGGSRRGSGDEPNREEGSSHPAHSRPADPPALDGMPNFYYAGMYDIVNKSAYKIRCLITCHHIPATTNQSVALNGSGAMISGVPDFSLALRVKVPPIARCSEKRKFLIPTFSKCRPAPRRRGIILVCTLLVVADGRAWNWALAEFADQRTLLGAAILRTRLGCGMPSRVIISQQLTRLSARCRRQ